MIFVFFFCSFDIFRFFYTHLVRIFYFLFKHRYSSRLAIRILLSLNRPPRSLHSPRKLLGGNKAVVLKDFGGATVVAPVPATEIIGGCALQLQASQLWLQQ
jgi:hypothetical protein